MRGTWSKTLGAAVMTAALLCAGPGAQADDNALDSRVTFTKDIVPILQENCQVCHRPGGANLGGMVAPMALVTYGETRPWAKSIANVVKNLEMPPWDATKEFHGVFENERTLTREEIDTVVKWVAEGAKKGRPEDAPSPREFPSVGGWQIGEPDLIVKMPERYFVADDVEDLYVDFETPLTAQMLPEDRYVKAVEFRPGSSAVHHIISLPLGGIAPGNDPTIFADGFAQLLRAGSAVQWQMHYHKEAGPGTGVWDQSEVAVRFYPVGYKPDHVIRMAPLENMDFEIPAGDPNYSANSNRKFDKEVMLISYLPHMHLRGKSALYVAQYPDGTEEKLLDIPNYDFNWQTTYTYREPKVIPAGTNVELTLWWDNSADNPANPDSTRAVRFGEPTTDEMMFGFMNYAYVDEPEAVDVDVATLESYTGKYEITETDRPMTIGIHVAGSTLMLSAFGQGSFPLVTVSETRFSFDFAGIEIEFQKDANGVVDSMMVYQRGEGVVARRLSAEEVKLDEMRDAFRSLGKGEGHKEVSGL